MSLAAPRVAVVIVNYRAARLIIDNFATLAAERTRAPGLTVTIVDNASPGDDAAALAALAARPEYAGFVSFIASPENGGFAKGNNLALRRLFAETPPPDYVFLLNPDAYVRPGAVAALVDFMEGRPEAGAAGARLEHPDGAPQISAFRFPSIAGEFEATARLGPVSALLARWRVAPPYTDEIAPADWVCGAGVMIRRRTLEEIGLFDEGYFLYFEETDLMLRARRKGWRTYFVPAARVVHLVGRSSGVIDGRRGERPPPAYWFRSRSRYFRRNHGAAYAALADCAWLAGSGLDWLRRTLTGADARAAGAAIAAFLARPSRAEGGGG
jgi:N-acetylglucosaminyl-diphospho-decaprenol L-rhamnosyltransferase